MLFLNPAYRSVEHGVLSFEQLMAGEFDFLVGGYADAFERLAAFGNVIGDGVLKAVAVGQPSKIGGQGGAGGASADDTGAAQVLHAACENLGGGSGTAVNQDGERSEKGLGPGEDGELDGGAAEEHGAEALALLVGEPAGHAGSQTPDAAGIAAQIDDEAIASLAGFDGLLKGGDERIGLEEQVEAHVAYVGLDGADRKSTRLNSSHLGIPY